MSGSCPAPVSMASTARWSAATAAAWSCWPLTHTPYPPRCAPPSRPSATPATTRSSGWGRWTGSLAGCSPMPPWPCSPPRQSPPGLCGRSAATDRRCATAPLATPPTVLPCSWAIPTPSPKSPVSPRSRIFAGATWRPVARAPHWPRRFTPRRSPGRVSTGPSSTSGGSPTSPCWRGKPCAWAAIRARGIPCWIIGYSATGNTATTATASGPRRARYNRACCTSCRGTITSPAPGRAAPARRHSTWRGWTSSCGAFRTWPRPMYRQPWRS